MPFVRIELDADTHSILKAYAALNRKPLNQFLEDVLKEKARKIPKEEKTTNNKWGIWGPGPLAE